jgi:hypothetical protein
MARSPDAGRTDPDIEAPSHATALACLVYAVTTFLLGYPALGGKFLINARSDQYLAGYAFREFAAQSLRAGHGIPQWEPFLQGGMPYIAAMHGDIFYPTALLRWILPTDVAMTWEFIIHLFLCGLFTFFFLRAWRFGFWAALTGGLAYMLGGSIAGFASPGHDGKLFVATLMPAALLLLTRGMRDGRAWAWGGLAAVVALAALSPHPQLLQYMLLLGGSFALYLALATDRLAGKLPTPLAVRRLALALGAVVLGLLVSALQYMPLFAYKPYSPRANGHSWADATSYSYPIEETLNWFWPRFSGILDGYWGRNGVHFHSDYFGAVVLVLAGAAFGAWRNPSFKRFWIGAGVVSLLWAYGGNTPLFHLIILVPGTRDFRAPSTIIYITAFAVAILAAIGIERVVAKRVSAKYVTVWTAAAAGFALLMSVGGYSTLSSAVLNSMQGLMDPQRFDALTRRAQDGTGIAVLDVWRSFLFAALACGAIWAYDKGRITAKAAVIGLVVFLVADLWSIERLYWIFSEPASTLFATDPAIEAIKADIAKSGPARVFNPPIGDGIAYELGREDRAFSGDKLWVDGLRVDGGYHGNELAAYQQMIGLNDQQIRFTPQFWRQENVRYIYVPANDSLMGMLASQLKIPPFVKLAGPVRNAAGSMVYSYKIPFDNPAAWVASAIVKAPQQVALATVLDARFDARTVAIADSAARDVNGVQLQTAPPAASVKASVTSYAAGAIDIVLDQPATAGQALVVSENYYPGWTATVDGKAGVAALMNYNLIGIPLPAGAKSVQLRFADAAYAKGKSVTLIAAVLTIAWLVAGLVQDRRRVTTPRPAVSV